MELVEDSQHRVGTVDGGWAQAFGVCVKFGGVEKIKKLFYQNVRMAGKSSYVKKS